MKLKGRTVAKISETFKGSKDWIKAENLGDEDVPVTISQAWIEEPRDDAPEGAKPQVILRTKEFGDKKFGLNATNRKMMVKLLGDDTDEWVGKRITLYTTEVEFQGETMLGIRIRLKLPSQKPVAAGAVLGEKGARALQAKLDAVGLTPKNVKAWLADNECEPASAIGGPVEEFPTAWVPVLKELIADPSKASKATASTGRNPPLEEDDIPF